ncbi:precorrin-8X methylmutase [Megasphaera hominis]|uniref:Precorrin-8X methylmutase n=1 Tax=Megasphaera hominis TaxID=159836 RepID=A0ABR6VIK2_9FIRM|nr:precorrin-8X methylmutase [uncultured Megasphaera sp.]MBC3536918.1 precorrin-8X methylmutase [Megasphaera hominis]
MKIEHIAPADIEKRSMEIIDQELGNITLPEDKRDIIKRVIHTTADFEFARTMRFSDDAVARGLDALKRGATILTDTNMACTGISAVSLKKLGGQKVCYMADPEIAAIAKKNGSTRATASMDKACDIEGPLIIAIGNAPTALLRLAELIEADQIHPDLVIGVPVGFVNVIASKEAIMKCHVPYIVATGRKGGSAIAAAICNALIYRLTR